MPQGGGAPVNADPGLEAEADKIGEKAAQGSAVAVGNVKHNSVSPTEGGIPAAIQCIRYRNLTSGEITDDLTAPPDNGGKWAPIADSAPPPRQSRRLQGQSPENSGLTDTRSGGSMASLRTVPDDPWKPLNELAHYGYQASEGRGLFYTGPVDRRGLGPQQVQTSIPSRNPSEHRTIFGQMTGGEPSSTQYQQQLGTAAPETQYEILHAMGHGEGGQMTQSPRNLASASRGANTIMIPYDKAISGNPNVLVDTSFDMRRGTERAERINQTFYHKDLPDETFFQQTIDGDLPDLTLQEYKEHEKTAKRFSDPDTLDAAVTLMQFSRQAPAWGGHNSNSFSTWGSNHPLGQFPGNHNNDDDDAMMT
jgi:hypothetical protein